MLAASRLVLLFQTTTTKASTKTFGRTCFGRNNNGLDQSTQFTWRLSVSRKEQFKQTIEKVEQVILDISLSSMPFVVAFLVKVVVL